MNYYTIILFFSTDSYVILIGLFYIKNFAHHALLRLELY